VLDDHEAEGERVQDVEVVVAREVVVDGELKGGDELVLEEAGGEEGVVEAEGGGESEEEVSEVEETDGTCGFWVKLGPTFSEPLIHLRIEES
jgi:hypothetical protein